MMRLAVAGYPLLSERQWRLAAEFTEKGHEVHLLVPSNWPQIPKNDEPPSDAPFNVHRHSTLFSGYDGRYVLPSVATTLRSIDPDVLFLHGEPWHPFTLTTVICASTFGIPNVVFSWENLDRVPSMTAQRKAERVCYRFIDGIIAGSSKTMERIRKRGFDGPISVTPQTGVDTNQFSPGEPDSTLFTEFNVPPDSKIILYTGRYVHEKGIDILIDAFPGVLKEVPDAHLLLVGYGQLENEIAARIRDWGIGNSVTLVTERQPYSRMPAIIRVASVFTYPSRTVEDWTEQFGYSVAEAMSCGIPVVTTTCGALPDVVGDGGTVIPENNSKALEESLIDLLCDEDRRTEIAKRARERAIEEYSILAVAEAHLELAHNVI